MRAYEWEVLAAGELWVAYAVAMGLALGFVQVLRPFAHRIGWVDRPNFRKQHEGAVPLVGGSAMLLALMAVQFFGPADALAPMGYWVGLLLLFLITLVDDCRPIRARYRLLVQFTAALAAVSLGGQVLPSLGNLLGTGDLSQLWLVLPVSLIGIVAVVNATNFSDGADGLCGGLAFIALFWLLVAGLLGADAAVAVGAASADRAQSVIAISATVMGCLGGFLFFNMRSPWRIKASVFMGDSGSMLVGFTLGWVAVHVTSSYGSASVSPVACLWIMFVPLADAVSCFVRRMLSSVTPMSADLKHLHHLVRRSGLSVGKSVLAIHAASFVCGMVGIAGWQAGIADYWMFAGFIAALAAFIAATNLAWRAIDAAEGVQVVQVAPATPGPRLSPAVSPIAGAGRSLG